MKRFLSFNLKLPMILTGIIILLSFLGLSPVQASTSSSLEASLPNDGGLFKQFNGKAIAFFIYHLSDSKDHSVKIQISTSADFKDIVMERQIKNHRTHWTTDLSGKFYWRLMLLGSNSNVLQTTPTRYFLITPDIVELSIENGNAFTYDTKKPNLSFRWGPKSQNIKPLFYRFKICKDTKFDDTLVNTDIKEPSFSTNQLGGGYYYYKVGVKWTEELPIQYSSIKVFTIRQKATAVPNEVPKETPKILEADKEPSQKEPANTPEKSPEQKQAESVGKLDPALIAREVPLPPKEHPKLAIIKPKPTPRNEPPKPLAKPKLFAPQNRAMLETIDKTVEMNLQWKSPGRAKQFVIEISPTVSFESKEELVTEDKSMTLRKQRGRYYWRVLAVDEAGIRSGYSVTWRFDITKPVISLSLAEPPDKSEETYTKRLPLMVFSWQVSSGQIKPLGYKLQIATDAEFTTPAFTIDTKETNVNMDNITDGSYFWRVAAFFKADDPPTLSDTHGFTVVKKVEPLEPPTLSSPADQFTEESYGDSTPITFLWDAPERAVSFEFSLADNPSFNEPKVQSVLEKKMTLSLPGGTFFWRVKGVDKIGTESPFSKISLFNVVKSKKTISLSSPTNGATSPTFKVTFSWDELHGCSTYELVISSDATMEKPKKTKKTSDRTMQVEMDDEDKYYWMVQCPLPSGHLIKSPIQSFAIVAGE